MKIYLLTQDDNTDYDTYDSLIVCAENEEDAKIITPSGKNYFEEREDHRNYYSWALNFDSIKCEEIGEANENQERGVVLASFNAG